MTTIRRVSMGIAASAALAAVNAVAAIFTVGADTACTHSSVTGAVLAAAGNGPGMDEIRIANNMTHDAVIAPIVSHNSRFRGGCANCAATTSTGRTVLHGSTGGSSGTFATSGTAANYQLILENLEIRDAGNNTRRGGAVRVDGRFSVELHNVTLANNRAARGGGVYIDGSDGASLLLADGTGIESNIATVSGGGLYCQNGGTVNASSATLLANTAQDGGSDITESGNGGGAALYGCTLFQAGRGGLAGVLANTAARDGGGFYLRGGSLLALGGNVDGPVYVVANTAAGSGGGLAINDALPGGDISEAVIRNSTIESNTAPTGAGIAAIAGGEVLMQRTLPANQCHLATRCSSLSNNDKPESAAACVGAAVFAGESANITLQNTYIEQNCASDHGWTFRQRLNSNLRIDSSVIARNGGSSPFFIDGSGITSTGVLGFTGLLEIAWSTVTGHYESTNISFISLPSFAPDSTGTLRIYGSILGEYFQQMTSVGGLGGPPPMTLDFDCLMLDPVFVGSGSNLRAVKRAFPYGMLDPAIGDYRLTGIASEAVDHCDASRAPRSHGDITGAAGVIDTSAPNVFGPYDLGAHEYGSDRLFADGFQ